MGQCQQGRDAEVRNEQRFSMDKGQKPGVITNNRSRLLSALGRVRNRCV